MGKQYWLEQYSPVMAMVALQFIYAGSALTGKAAFASGVSPLVFVVYRQSIATIALAPATIVAAIRRRKDHVALGLKGFSLIFVLTLIGVTIDQLLYYQGLKLASASLASAVSNTIPAITFLMAASIGMERVEIRSVRSMAKVFGTIICVGGAISMAFFKGPKLMSTNSLTLASILHSVGENWMLGCLFLLGSSSCWAIWLILQVPICKNYVDPLSLSSWMSLLSSLQSAIITFFLVPDLKAWRLNSTFELMCCLYAGAIGCGLTFYLQAWCISRRGPLFSAMFNPLCTVIVTIVAIPLLHEHLYIGSSIQPAMGMQYWFEQYSPVMAMVALQFIYAGSALSAEAAFAAGVSLMVFVTSNPLLQLRWHQPEEMGNIQEEGTQEKQPRRGIA